MASYWLSWLSRQGFTQICVARGSVSWGRKDDDAAGELQLWNRERDNDYYLYASKTAGVDRAVCKVLDAFTLSLPKVINEEVEISFRPILKTNSTMWED